MCDGQLLPRLCRFLNNVPADQPGRTAARVRSAKEAMATGLFQAHESKQKMRELSRHCTSLLENLKAKDWKHADPQKSTYFFLFVILLSITLIRYLFRRNRSRRSQSSGTSTPTTPSLEKGPSLKTARKPGEWKPQTFLRPKPPPYPDWSIEHTKPLPYRPFRHGPKYFVTMGLRSVSYDDWIELDNQFPRFHADKTRRILERGPKCCKTAPEAYDGAVELLEEFCSYLPDRYPTLYRRTERGMTNLWSGETFDIIARPLAEDPMQMASRMVQDDLAIMFEKPDGQYYLLAGAILLAGFWRLDDKFGMPLSEIHTSGAVPQFREKLEKGMMNFFRRVKPEELVARHNYFLQVDDDLAWSHSIGDEDAAEVSWSTAAKNKAVEHHFFRSERQTLRRLPRSGGVVFTIRTYFHPITEISGEDYVPGRLASGVRSWGEDVSRYKGKERYGEVLLEYLDGKHREQVERGLDVSQEEDVRAYPW